MTDNKNLIETVQIDGKILAIERQGNNNCWVNLTQMANPFDKKPSDWLRAKSTQEYLEVAGTMISRFADSRNGQNGSTDKDLIIVRQGGTPEEQGTWCTDYRIAMRFAQWLDAEFAWKVDDLLVRIASGERIVSDKGFFNLGGKQWISCTAYCSIFKKSIHSFYGLLGNYPREFTFWDGSWYMSRDLFKMKETQAHFEASRLTLRAQNNRRQMTLPFAEPNDMED